MVRCVRHNDAECGVCSLKDGVRTYLSSEETLTDWQRQVAEVANARYRQSDRVRPPYAGAGVSVTAHFLFDTPKRGRYGIDPISRAYGDSDKLSRTLLDALTVARVYADDAQVVELNARKRWADDDRGETAGLLCRVESV
jgi:Holliday junction resolvase RusA-like endonuclease